jgi:hypothetical protein
MVSRLQLIANIASLLSNYNQMLVTEYRKGSLQLGQGV